MPEGSSATTCNRGQANWKELGGGRLSPEGLR